MGFLEEGETNQSSGEERRQDGDNEDKPSVCLELNMEEEHGRDS